MESLVTRTASTSRPTLRRLSVALAVAPLSVALVATPTLASGGGGGGVIGGGHCTRVSQWEIQAKANNGSIQVRADVFTLPASTWTWKLDDNGTKFAKGTAIANRERHD